MSKIDITDEILSKGFKDLRDKFNITEQDLSECHNGIRRVKCTDAEYFPNPPSFWRESKISLYRLLSEMWSDYIKVYEYNGLRVVASVCVYPDNKEWLHISFSRAKRMPDYKDIKMVRDHFIGEDKKCFMVFPNKDHYVNIHENCLHLWYTKESGIPDFDVKLDGIGPSV